MSDFEDRCSLLAWADTFSAAGYPSLAVSLRREVRVQICSDARREGVPGDILFEVVNARFEVLHQGVGKQLGMKL